MVSRRERNYIRKAIHDVSSNNSIRKKQSQMQVQQVKGIAILKEDEFTVHKPIENILKNFALEAKEAYARFDTSMKGLVLTYGRKIEEQLTEMGKPQLISGICNELIDVLKQARVKWSEKYIRKCLPERYKDPTKRSNALKRKREGPPGTPPDTGLSADELEARLNRKSPAGKFTVKTNMKYVEIANSKKENTALLTRLRKIMKTSLPPEGGSKGAVMLTFEIPLIVNVNAAQQEAGVKLDVEEWKKVKE